MLDIIMCALIKFANMLLFFLVEWWVEGLIWVLDELPDADFSADPVDWGPFGNFIGYFIPIATMLKHFTFIMGAYLLYLGVQHILRLVKAVR